MKQILKKKKDENDHSLQRAKLEKITKCFGKKKREFDFNFSLNRNEIEIVSKFCFDNKERKSP